VAGSGDHSSEHVDSMKDVNLLTALEIISFSRMTLFCGAGLFLEMLSLLLFFGTL
jgi:hypothetical protein